MSNETRIPSLDGCRAIAILLVVYSHVESARNAWSARAFDWGTLGVFVFFVISGFIITTLLQREREKHQSVSLRQFYIRRCFKIHPPLTLFLAAMAVLSSLGLSDASGRSILFSFTFLRNYLPGPSRVLHHLWSLSVEEQFYLIWPFLFVTMSRRAVCRLLMVVVLVVPFIRLFTVLRMGTSFTVGLSWAGWHTQQLADGLAWGCLLAIRRDDLRSTRFYRWLSTSYAALLLPVIVALASYTYPPIVFESLGKTLIFACTALCIDLTILRSESVVGRFLNWTPFAGIGKISYSLYLWQQLFFFARSDHPYQWFPVGLVFLLPCALFSYLVVEQPAVRIGRRLASRGRNPLPAIAAAATEP